MKSVFVSSTFRDMNFERDLLNRRIAPKINHQLARYNQSVRIVDLRWGVDTTDMTEQEATDRVLNACLRSIEDCKPYIIVLLGDRYGYIPEGYDVSVTHLEILRGVFECSDSKHVYIYFRDADYSQLPEDMRSCYIEGNSEAMQQLTALKAALQAEFPQCCRHYKAHWSAEEHCIASDELEAMILTDLEGDLIRENESIRYRSDLHKQLCENEEVLAERVKFAYSNQEKIAADLGAMENTTRPYGVIGDGGAGKSIYISLLCAALRQKGERAQILFCGDNAFSASARNAAEMVLYMLSNVRGEEYDYEACAGLGYEALIAKIIEKRDGVEARQYLLLDAIDKCDQGMLNFVYWCNSFLTEQVKIVFSSRMLEQLRRQKGSLALVEMCYDRDDYRKMVAAILSQHSKSIADECVEYLLDKVSSPLQLQILLRRLLNLRTADYQAIAKLGGGMDAINRYLKQFIDESPENMTELIAAYMKEQLEECKNPAFSVCALSFLTFCEYGLQEDDLRAMFSLLNNTKWVALDYIEFLEQFSFFLRIRDNGRLDISHDILRQTLANFLEDNKKGFCGLIAMYFLYRDKHDGATVKTFFRVAYLGNQHKRLAEFLSKHQHTLTAGDVESGVLAAQIRSELQKLFLQDDGVFLFNAARSIRSVKDFLFYQATLSSALLTINDFHDEETILKIVYAAMFLPMQLDIFEGELFEMEMMSCLRFMNRHSVSSAKIDEFRMACEAVIEKRAGAGRPEAKRREDPLEEMVEKLRTTQDHTDKTLIWVKLSKEARAMAASEKTADRAYALCLELVQILEEGKLFADERMKDIMAADVYTSLGVVCKTKKEWEKGIHYDQCSLDIYKKIYENSPTADMFRKYRERVYNIANITEAWAMHEKTNIDLWHKTKECYGQCYGLELMAVSQGLAGREILQAASCIVSFGTALINTGSYDEGVEKYKEGIAMVKDAAKNNRNPDLYTELSTYLLDCIYQLLVYDQQKAAIELSANINSYLSAVVESSAIELTEKLVRICSAFSNSINDIIRSYMDRGNLEGQMTASKILCGVYEAILPVAPFEVKANIIMTRCNICALLFWNLQDYAAAYEEYQALLHLVEEKDLAVANKNGRYVDEVNSRLIDAYVRSLLCLEKLGRKDEIEPLLGEGLKWARYIADRLNMTQGDAPRILYEMGNALARKESSLAVVLVMMAFEAMLAEDYDKEAHPETVKAILQVVSQFGGEDNS